MVNKKRELVLALAVIILELIGGMQSYLNQMILPIMSADLGARHLYGLITGVSSIVAMLGLPFGAALLQRYQLPRLLLVMTLILCAGAIVSATAPNIGLYLSGLVIRGFAGSALAMTSIGAVALGLSGRARQLTLAFSSASWVIASLVGPTYAAWVTHLLSWRWAMLLYLPFLLIARFIVAANLRSRQKTKKAPLPFSAALGAGLGIFLTIVPLQGIGKYLLGLLGLAILGWVTVYLMPAGTFWQAAPRKRALAGMFFLTASYFSANELVTLTAHDLFHANSAQLGWIELAGGLGWAVMGLLCGLKPASTARVYRLRAGIGVGVLALCGLLTVGLVLSSLPAAQARIAVICLWTACGIGMGITYIDTMNVFFEEPEVDDSITIEQMASASVMVESLSSAIFIPLTTSLAAFAFQKKAVGQVGQPPMWRIPAASSMGQPGVWWRFSRSSPGSTFIAQGRGPAKRPSPDGVGLTV